jgi:hypothetical protein
MNFTKFVKALREKGRRGTPSHWGGVSILTFNYDIGVEVAFIQQDLDYEYCLGAAGTVRRRDKTSKASRFNKLGTG